MAEGSYAVAIVQSVIVVSLIYYINKLYMYKKYAPTNTHIHTHVLIYTYIHIHI